MGCGRIPRWTSRPFGKESTAVDVTRLAIEQIEKIFLQGLAASPRFDREGATRGFRDAPNLESNHECILPSAVAAGRWSQFGDAARPRCRRGRDASASTESCAPHRSVAVRPRWHVPPCRPARESRCPPAPPRRRRRRRMRSRIRWGFESRRRRLRACRHPFCRAARAIARGTRLFRRRSQRKNASAPSSSARRRAISRRSQLGVQSAGCAFARGGRLRPAIERPAPAGPAERPRSRRARSSAWSSHDQHGRHAARNDRYASAHAAG